MDARNRRAVSRWGRVAGGASALCLIAALFPSPVAAQPPVRLAARSGPAHAETDAERTALEQEYRKQRQAAVLLQLGELAARRGAGPRAADYYQRFAELAGDSKLPPPARALLAQELPSAIEVRLQADPGAWVRVDGWLAGFIEADGRLRLLLRPGEHDIALDLAGRAAAYRLTVEQGAPINAQCLPGSNQILVTRPSSVLLFLCGGALVPEPPWSAACEAALRGLQKDDRAYTLTEATVRQRARSTRLRCSGEDRCLLELGAAAAADYVVAVEPEAGGGQAGPGGRVRVLDVRVGQASTSRPWQCRTASCADADSTGALREQAQEALQEALDKPTSELQLTLRPSGAAAQLDGHPVTRGSPVRLFVFSGPHQLTVRKPDYLPLSTELLLRPGESRALVFELTANEAAMRRRKLRTAKWALFGLGLAGLVAGAVLLPQPAAQPVYDPDPNEGRLLLWPAGIAALAGGALLEGGALLLWRLERSADREAQAREAAAAGSSSRPLAEATVPR